MKILNICTLLCVIISFSMLCGILIPAMTQPTDNNQTLTTLEPLLKGNTTLNEGTNMANVTTPAGETNTYG